MSNKTTKKAKAKRTYIPSFKAWVLWPEGLYYKYGFPRTAAKSVKIVRGFQTGDIVKAIVTKGKKVGTYIGRVAVRKTGSFNIKTKGITVQGIGYRYCKKIHAVDGYCYIT